MIVSIFILFYYFYNSIADGGFKPWTSQLETPIGASCVSRLLADCCHFNNIINESLSYFFCNQWHISLKDCCKQNITQKLWSLDLLVVNLHVLLYQLTHTSYKVTLQRSQIYQLFLQKNNWNHILTYAIKSNWYKYNICHKIVLYFNQIST